MASASFANRQLEYDTLKSLQLKVSFLFLPSFQRGMERACAMLFSRSFLIACYRLQGDCCSFFLKRNFHPDRACYLATGLPVESGTNMKNTPTKAHNKILSFERALNGIKI